VHGTKIVAFQALQVRRSSGQQSSAIPTSILPVRGRRRCQTPPTSHSRPRPTIGSFA